MKKNLLFFIFIIVAVFALYLTKQFYSDHNLEKTIGACVFVKLKESDDISREDAKKYCENEIKAQLN